MTSSVRRRILGTALAITLIATVWVSRDPAPSTDAALDVMPVLKVSTDAVPVLTNSADARKINITQHNSMSRAISQQTITDVFASTGWQVTPSLPVMAPSIPPPAPPPPSLPMVETAPPAPSAPPLPFRYLGRLQKKDDPWRIFLLYGNKVVMVHEGDTLDDTYRVTKVGREEVRFLYLPLQIEQSLP